MPMNFCFVIVSSKNCMNTQDMLHLIIESPVLYSNRIPALCKMSQPTMSSSVPFMGSSVQAHMLMDMSPHENTAPRILLDQCKLIYHMVFSPCAHMKTPSLLLLQPSPKCDVASSSECPIVP